MEENHRGQPGRGGKVGGQNVWVERGEGTDRIIAWLDSQAVGLAAEVLQGRNGL